MKFEVTCDSNGTNCWVPVEQAKQLLCDAMELEAEVERLRASSFVTAVPSEQYERVIKAGDDLANELHSCEPDEQIILITRWNAAKEGISK